MTPAEIQAAAQILQILYDGIQKVVEFYQSKGITLEQLTAARAQLGTYYPDPKPPVAPLPVEPPPVPPPVTPPVTPPPPSAIYAVWADHPYPPTGYIDGDVLWMKPGGTTQYMVLGFQYATAGPGTERAAVLTNGQWEKVAAPEPPPVTPPPVDPPAPPPPPVEPPPVVPPPIPPPPVDPDANYYDPKLWPAPPKRHHPTDLLYSVHGGFLVEPSAPPVTLGMTLTPWPPESLKP